jgi:hypothetical protein
MSTTPVAAPKEDIKQLLFQEGVLFGLSISRWTARSRINSNDLLIDVNKEAVDSGFKKLMPSEALQPLANIESRARAVVNDRSMYFEITGGRFVAKGAVAGIIQELTELKAAFQVEVEKFLESYPRFKDEQIAKLDRVAYGRMMDERAKYVGRTEPAAAAKLTELNEYYAQQQTKNRTLYPSVQELRRKFGFDWRMFGITDVQQLGGLTAEQVQAANAQLQQQLAQWVREATFDMHRTLGEVAVQVRVMLERQGKLNPRNLRPLFDAFQAFEALDFVGTSAVRNVINDIRSRFQVGNETAIDMDATADAVNESGAAFSTLLDTVGRLAVDDVARQAGVHALRSSGRFARVLDD